MPMPAPSPNKRRVRPLLSVIRSAKIGKQIAHIAGSDVVPLGAGRRLDMRV